jgi:hypothetical protein
MMAIPSPVSAMAFLRNARRDVALLSARRGVSRNRLTAASPSITAKSASFTTSTLPYAVPKSAANEPTRNSVLTMPLAVSTATHAIPSREKRRATGASAASGGALAKQ